MGTFGQIAHDLEIFSEDGVKFTLILNGRVMNEQAMSNIQVLNTDKDYLNMKIKFEDPAIPDIERKMLQIANPGTDESVRNKPVSVVYTIVEKKGDYKLRFASRSEKKIQDQPDIIIIENNTVNQQESGFKLVVRW
ncbi:MAG: hypothetical protein A3D92_22675 [Bacteroidetes bacterium RIFCSPHIGHO2_02_FULL_44_7]|nr:MAG: hypothetical protein A3D92_22675 [Bacteroidetes bacterium RIFCSPHIGHO2_02_FULL_44_7]